MEAFACYMPPELAGQWEPLAVLKENALRQSLLLRNLETGDKAVLKRVAIVSSGPGGPEDPAAEYRLLQEIAGDGVPAAYQCFESGGASYLLREYIPGETLLDYMQKRGPLPMKETALIGIALCEILERLHNRLPPVVHRDVKAENVVRTPDGRYYIIDFGIARRFERGARQDTFVSGTPSLAPPEQYGYRQTDPRADIYAMGCLLRELATGEILSDRGAVPVPLRGIVSKCLRFDPAQRFSSAAALERALKPIAAGKLRPFAVAVGLTVALLLLAVFSLCIRSAPHTPPGPAPAEDASVVAEPVDNGVLYRFASASIETEVCRQLGKEPGTVTYDDLDQITSLLLCGSTPYEEWYQLWCTGAEAVLDGKTCDSRGTVDTLEDIPYLRNLRELSLCNQEIEDLTPLAGCGIQNLSLHGNRIRDISPLRGCTSLLTLYISGNPISDLTPLRGCTGLWRINLGATRVTELSVLTELPYLTYLELHDCSLLEDDSALESLEGLTVLSIRPVSEQTIEAIDTLQNLELLYIWGVDPMKDMTPLADLHNLESLFLGIYELPSLEGIESLQQLEYLDIRSSLTLDLTPLAALTELKQLNVVGLSAQDWSVLTKIPALERVVCSDEQSETLRQALANTEIELVSGS